jgi:L-xylulose reductase
MELRVMRVLVTGAASGIGAATARLLAEQEIEVVPADLSPGEGGVQLDVTNRDAWLAVLNEAWPLHGLVNCAGIRSMRSILDTDEADFEQTLRVNLIGPFTGMRLIARRWLDQGMPGVIVNVASLAGLTPRRDIPDYAASKAGLISVSRALAGELGSAGIRDNVVAPGAVDTPMGRSRHNNTDRDAFLAGIPQGRIADPAEIAQTISFLLSDASSYMTGSVMVVDGGRSAVL